MVSAVKLVEESMLRTRCCAEAAGDWELESGSPPWRVGRRTPMPSPRLGLANQPLTVSDKQHTPL